MGCNTHVHGSNDRNLPLQLSLSQTSKNAMSKYDLFVFWTTKLEKRAEQFLTGSKGSGSRGSNGER
jgi:hypothetical protein